MPGKIPVAVGLVGPYDIDEPFEQTVFFTDVQRPGGRVLVTTLGDRFQALSLGVEMCRLHLILLIKEFPEGLYEETGELYSYYDLPPKPAAPPPLDYDRLLATRRTAGGRDLTEGSKST
jgi:hypothetical protein